MFVVARTDAFSFLFMFENRGYMCNLLHAIILGSGRGYRCRSVCDWWRHIRNVVWRRVTVIITWFHQRLSLAATLWPLEYFRTRLKACNYCMQQLQRVACN